MDDDLETGWESTRLMEFLGRHESLAFAVPLGVVVLATAALILTFGIDEGFELAGGEIDALTGPAFATAALGLALGVWNAAETKVADAAARLGHVIVQGVVGALLGLLIGGMGMFGGFILVIVSGLVLGLLGVD